MVTITTVEEDNNSNPGLSYGLENDEYLRNLTNL